MSVTFKGLYRFDEFELNTQRRMLLRDGQPVQLSPKAFEVLACLLRHPGEVVTKEHLLKAVWPESFVEEGNLAQQISALRKSLTDRANYIVTVPGRGYQFAAEVLAEERASQDISIARPPGDVVIERVLERTHIVVEESVTALAVPQPRTFHRSAIVYSAVAVAVVALAAWLGLRWLNRTVPGDHHEIVLADIENTTGDPEFNRALNSALTADLKQSPYLLVASATKRQETLKLMERSPQETLTPSLARELCQRIGDQAVLVPTIARLGRKYLLTLTATDCESGDDLTQSKATASDEDSILQALDTLAASMRRHLGEPLGSLRRTSTPLLAKTTNSLDALKAYTLAHDLGTQGKYQQAIPLFQKAIELDPKFAVAYSDLGIVYSNLGEQTLSTETLSKAYELREYAIEQDKLAIISIYHGTVTGDINESIRNYETWSALYPHASAPRTNLANNETQIGRNDLAIEPAQQAVELSPGETTAYVVLARAQMHVGQLQQARATCEKAIALKLDDASIHGLLLELAFVNRDEAGVDAEVAWSRGKPAEPFLLLQKMISEFARGRARSAEALLVELTDKYRKQGLNERADRMQGAVPRMELTLGRIDQARIQLRALPSLPGSTDIPVALALTGQIPQAEAILANEVKLRPNGTLVQNDRAPQIRAAIALAQNRPQEAIQSLQRSLPYDLHTYDVPTLRGLAYMAAKQPAQAEGEFHKIIDHLGLDPLSNHFALAHLGLARALAQQTNFAASRLEYESFFALLKDADSDLPVLLEARKEYAQLPR